jgi:uncharacterized protein
LPGIREALLAAVAEVAAGRDVPRVADAFIPEPRLDPGRDAEFGMIALTDGSAGLYYAWMGESQRGMSARFVADDLSDRDPVELAKRYASDNEAERSLALAAINAITAWSWRQVGFTPPPARSSFGISLQAGDHLGLVGNFPPLVRQATALGLAVTVVERKAHMVRREGPLRITLDPRALSDCNKIVCTAATLINDSLDEVLEHCRHAGAIALVGPTASCFPAPLFARGITVVGGLWIIDPNTALARLHRGEKFGDAAFKFEVTPAVVCRDTS